MIQSRCHLLVNCYNRTAKYKQVPNFVKNIHNKKEIYLQRHVIKLYLYEVGLTCIRPGIPWLSIRDAVLTVSPNKQYLGILIPTTPATTGPLWNPTRIWKIQSFRTLLHFILLVWITRLEKHLITEKEQNKQTQSMVMWRNK